MDVDEEVHPGEDENSHLSIGIMSDIRDDDDADQSMNSEEQNFDSLDQDQRTDNPSLSNEVSEIDDNITSHMPSTTIGLNYDHSQSENVLNQEKNKSSSIEKCQILDIHMESSNMSLKVDDDSTHMSTDMKEGIDNFSSDVSMHSEQEVQSPLSYSKISEKEVNNLKDIVHNTNVKPTLNLKNTSSSVQLCNPEIIQIEENIEMSHSNRNLSFEGTVQQQEKITLKTTNNELVTEESTENLCSIDKEEKVDNKKAQDKDLLFSTEIQSVKDQDSADMKDDTSNCNESEMNNVIKSASFQHSEVKETPKNKNNSEKGNLDENLLLPDNRGTENHVIEERSKIKSQDSAKLETGQNENQNEEIRKTGNFLEERSIKEIDVQEQKTSNTILINNEKTDIVTSVVVPEKGNFQIKPEFESLSIDSDEYPKKTEITLKENKSTSAVQSPSDDNKDYLVNSDSLTVIQKTDDKNFNYKIAHNIKESKTLDTLDKETGSLSQNSDSKCGTQNEEEYLKNIQSSSELEEEIKDSEKSNEDSEHFIEDAKDIANYEAKNDTKVVDECEDNIRSLMEEEINEELSDKDAEFLTEDEKTAADYKIEEERKIVEPADNLPEEEKVIVKTDEVKEPLMDGVERDKMTDECLVDLPGEMIQPLVGEEAEKPSKVLNNCSSNSSEDLRVTVMYNVPEKYSKGSDRVPVDCTNGKSEVGVNEKIEESEDIVKIEEPMVDKNISIECSNDCLDDAVKSVTSEEPKRDKVATDECSVEGKKSIGVLNRYSDNLTEDLGVKNETKKDLKASDDNADEKMDLQTDKEAQVMKEIVRTEKLKVEKDNIIESSNNSFDDAGKPVMSEETKGDESLVNITKDSVQPQSSEEAAEYRKVSKISNNLPVDSKDNIVDDENKEFSKGSDECTSKESDVAMDEKVVKEAICSDDYINKNIEIITLDDEAEKDDNEFCNLAEEQDILSKSLNTVNDKTKDIVDVNKVKKDLGDSDDNLNEVTKRDVTGENLTNELDKLKNDDDQKKNNDHCKESVKNNDNEEKTGDRDDNSDSDSYMDISEYLINLNKKDFISTSDIFSDDSLSYQNTEATEQKSEQAALKSEESITFPKEQNKTDNEEKDLEKCGNASETQERQVTKAECDQVTKAECDSSKTFTEAADNSDASEIASEIDSNFEVIDEVCGEEEEDNEKEKKKITTEGLAKSFPKNLFVEERGKDIDSGVFTRFVILGDSFISHFIKMWPANSKIKPYFLYKNKLTFNQLLRYKIQEHEFFKNSEKIFVLIICNLHEVALYSSYKYNGCHGSHTPFKYIRKIETEPRAVNHYLSAMSSLKHKMENNGGIFVSFSYLPVIDIGYICQELCDQSRMKNFNCNCDFSLGTAAKVDSANSIININRNIFYKQLNETKLAGIFEYCPINLTFCIDRWCIYSKILKFKENSDVLNLSYLLDQVNCLETDLKQNVKSDSETHLPEILFNTPDAYRILVIGDTWLKYVAEHWDNKLDAKPFFYCKNGLTFKCIHKVIASLTRTGVKLLLITTIPSGEFLTESKFSECKDHDPLKYLSPSQAILKDPLAYAEIIIKKLDLLSLNAQSNKLCKILFLTSYPSFFKSYFKSLHRKHVKSYPSHESSKSLEDLVDCSDFDTKIETFYKKVNNHVVSLNKELGIPTCNIFSLMCKLSTNDMLIFPTEEKSPERVQRKLLALLQKYTCNVNYNLHNEHNKNKIDQRESITEAILKSSDISIKIENKIAEDESVSGLEESKFSKSERIVVLKKKEASPRYADNSAYSSGLKHKYAEKHTKATDDKRDYHYNTKSRYPKSDYTDHRGEAKSDYTDHRGETKSDYADHRGEESSRSHRSPKYHHDRKPSPNRYDFSKYTREDDLHRKKEIYTRSRSKDRKYPRSRSQDRKYTYHGRSRSRSRDRRNRSRSRGRRYDRSRSKDRRYKSRSTDRRLSRSKSRNRSKRHLSRSRSRTPTKKRFRSRSRSPYEKHHRRKEHDSSSNRKSRSRSRSHPNRTSDKLSRELNSVEKEAVDNLWAVHQRERDMYRERPENHPDHDRVKRMWLNIMNSQGLNTYDQSVLQCWWEYWLKKMEDLIEASWEEKRKDLLAVLSSKNKASKDYTSSSTDSSSSDYESRESVKQSKKKKKSKNKSSQRKKKSRKHSPSKSKNKEELLNTDIPTSVEEMEKLLQEFVQNNSKSKDHEVKSHSVSKSKSKEKEKFLDVTSILCQISEKFGALGLSLSVLHQKALECVKNDLSPYNCIDEDAKMLLELICDKIKKMLEHSDMTFVKRAIVQEAHDRLVPFLESFEKPKDPVIDIDLLAKATLGLQASEVINFIKTNLDYKGHKDLSNEQLMNFYLKVKDYQMKILDEKQAEKKTNSLDFSKPSSSRSSFELNVSHVLSSGSEIDSAAFKRLQIKNNFLALPMHEKLKKFARFHSLSFEEKSFLLSHLDDLEKTDEDLSRSLRIMIAQNMKR